MKKILSILAMISVVSGVPMTIVSCDGSSSSSNNDTTIVITKATINDAGTIIALTLNNGSVVLENSTITINLNSQKLDNNSFTINSNFITLNNQKIHQNDVLTVQYQTAAAVTVDTSVINSLVYNARANDNGSKILWMIQDESITIEKTDLKIFIKGTQLLDTDFEMNGNTAVDLQNNIVLQNGDEATLQYKNNAVLTVDTSRLTPMIISGSINDAGNEISLTVQDGSPAISPSDLTIKINGTVVDNTTYTVITNVIHLTTAVLKDQTLTIQYHTQNEVEINTGNIVS